VSAEAQSSLSRALARAMAASTGGAIAVCLVALVALHLFLAPRDVEQRLAGLGDVIGVYGLAALEFDDPDAGREALAALAAIPEARFALLLRPDGSLFATWGELPARLDPAALAAQPGLTVSGWRADWVRAVERDGKPLGALVIRADLSAVATRIVEITGVLVAISVAALGVAWLIAARLREQLAGPLAELAASSAQLAAGDLTTAIRVERSDEVGALAGSLRRMGESLRALVSQAREGALAVTGESNRLADASASMLDEARRQQRAAEETAASLGRLGASLGEVSATVSSLAENAARSSRAMAQVDAAAEAAAADIDRLFGTADAAAASLQQASVAVRQIAGNASALATATNTTHGAMQELRASLRAVDEHARQSHAATSQAAEAARRGEGAMAEAAAGMDEIEESFGSIEQIVNDLAERSKAIEQVLGVIEDVVDRTNLLALNAGIISAQAGTHGKAFAVVAEEVRSLAERTADSTREIGASIASVLKGVDEAVAATASGARRVREGARRTEEAGTALREIRASAERSSAAVESIVDATARQVGGVAAVGGELDAVKALVDQITLATREQEGASVDIQRGVEEVRQLAESLKRSTAAQTQQTRFTSDTVERVAAGLAQIRAATEGQRQEAERIAEALEVFRDVASEATRRSEAMQSTVQALQQRSGRLGQEIGRFRV
jgi:methyl-accepting chemotaxis protein